MILNKDRFVKALQDMLRRGSDEELRAIVRVIWIDDPSGAKRLQRALERVGDENIEFKEEIP